MTKTRKISGLLWALLFAWGSVNAAGLGRLTVQSALGQPLKAEIELLSVTKDDLADINARLASPEAFRQARIDRQETLGNLRFSVDQRANGQPIIRITSSVSVPDPFLDMLIELNWSSGRLIREYTILLDPPASAKPAEVIRPVVAAEPPRNGAAISTPQPMPAVEARKPKPVAPPPVAAQPKVYGPVRSGETLRAIAGKLKKNEVSLEQMMVGLYQANKGAFQANNMNRLNRGAVLNVPDTEAVSANTQTDAIRTLRGHTSEWHAYRRQLAEMAGEAVAP
jgi:pilus assembly protein FimV